jgi:hypothetical protein
MKLLFATLKGFVLVTKRKSSLTNQRALNNRGAHGGTRTPTPEGTWT